MSLNKQKEVVVGGQITSTSRSLGEIDGFILEGPVLGRSGLELVSFFSYFVSNLEQAIETLREVVLETPEQKRMEALQGRIEALEGRISGIRNNVAERKEEDQYFSMIQAVQMDDLEGLQLLLWNGDNPNQVHLKSGNTPLHFAVLHNRKDHVQSLLQTLDIDRECKNKKGLTPIELCKDESIRSLFENIQSLSEDVYIKG